MPAALKIISDNGASFVVGGYAVVYGGHDVTGDRFTKATDFWFDRLTHTPPVLYQHGGDAMFKRLLVGRVISKTSDDFGLWVEAQITAAKQYADAIRKLVEKGILGWSSGSVPHLVQRKSTNDPSVAEITSWPIVEVSLTPTPAEPRTVGVRELKALAERDPWLLEIADEAEEVETKATLDAAARDALSTSDYAYIDSSGGRHLPINDEGHVRAAMSRFNQTSFESTAKKKTAARKILARARSLGMDVADDSAIAQAAKGAPPMDLEDTAFAFIEPGGMLDEERKTVPRSNRHFGHHDENGEVDVESIKAILADPDLFKFGDVPVAHILRHAQAAGVYGRHIARDDAHEEQWSKGLAARMLVREYKSGLLAEAIARNYLAYEDVGIDTKDGMHVSPKLQKQIADEQEVWVSLVTKANEIEQGIDGQALVDTWRTAFQLLDLEEVA